MQFSRSSVFLEVIEGLSKSPHIHQGNELEMAQKILYSGSQFLKIQRVNAWMMNKEGTALDSLLAYDKLRDEFYKEGPLEREVFPIWFRYMQRNDIIISTDARNEPFNSELVEPYLIPLDIHSMMEVPIISSGQIKGLICFEHTGEIRQWSNDEQHFAIALTQLLTLSLETKEKNSYRDQLEVLVNEKTKLVSDINYRIQNNLSILTAFIRSEIKKAKDEYHISLFENILNKTYSLEMLQTAVSKSTESNRVNIGQYIENMLSDMQHGKNSSQKIVIQKDLQEIYLSTTHAIPYALLINELLSVGMRNSVATNQHPMNISLSSTSEKSRTFSMQFQVKSNAAYSEEDLEVIRNLTDQIDGTFSIHDHGREKKLILEF
ncbi:MAG: GAF domain-containing protein [Cryomorphaceae bacterium]|jgi:two-component sensor histidine kinase|nr:GAF domain-containing protein [Cryomorphaceae bacterium]